MGSATVLGRLVAPAQAGGVSPNAFSRRSNWFGERDRLSREAKWGPGRNHRHLAGDVGAVSGEDAGHGARDARAPHGFAAFGIYASPNGLPAAVATPSGFCRVCVYLRESADRKFAAKL